MKYQNVLLTIIAIVVIWAGWNYYEELESKKPTYHYYELSEEGKRHTDSLNRIVDSLAADLINRY